MNAFHGLDVYEGYCITFVMKDLTTVSDSASQGRIVILLGNEQSIPSFVPFWPILSPILCTVHANISDWILICFCIIFQFPHPIHISVGCYTARLSIGNVWWVTWALCTSSCTMGKFHDLWARTLWILLVYQDDRNQKVSAPYPVAKILSLVWVLWIESQHWLLWVFVENGYLRCIPRH